MILLSTKHTGRQTITLTCPPSVVSSASIGSRMESEGPLSGDFDHIFRDPYCGKNTWEKAESTMLEKAFNMAISKASLTAENIQYIFAGDLLNQCIGSTFGLRSENIPFFGLYGACSTMAEGLSLAALMIDGGFADTTAAVTSSHFCSAERQFRTPLEYGSQRTPTSQWTVTGAGAIILSSVGDGPYITHITPGRIVDAGIKDANNMGAAMAPAAYDTISTHFSDLGVGPDDYDLILTGDLGSLGSAILVDLFHSDGIDIADKHNDCGMMIYSAEKQDVHAGGSGCGCCASVLCGHIMNGMRSGRWNKVLVAATGALMSPTSSQQGESIPGICCAVSISNTK